MKIGPYTITSPLPLTREEGILLTAVLPSTLAKNDTTLGGRGALRFVGGISGKEVAVKPYLRGGLVGKVNRRYYLERGKSRARKEYDLLRRMKGSGICAPAPLGFIESGRFLRSCWLLMETIPHEHTLATVPFQKNALDQIFDRLRPQMKALLDLGIHHVDLHPGNIIMNRNGQPVLIDFDKAREGITDRQALCRLYVKRWIRAVKKHNLPDELADQFTRIMNELEP